MTISLKFQSGYKSIESIDDIDLPDFTVITGLNGSGKSQLLESILQPQTGIQLLSDGNELMIKKLVTHSTLVPNNSGAADPTSLKQSVTNAINMHTQFRQQRQRNHNHTFNQTIRDPKQIRLFDLIAKDSLKAVEELSDDDIYRNYPIDDGLTVNDVFQQSFSILFKRYHIRFEDNLIDEFRYEKYGEGSFLERNDFIIKYGFPPWEVVNRILEEAHVNYRVSNPEGLYRDAAFTLKLVNNITGVEINFSDLSSGEKVLVSLALSLYNIDMLVDFPQILLMDEPDAPLHPSMTKNFINVLQKVFVKEKKVKVIITTHSPSTVALSPNDSIFVMGTESPRLKKSSKDEALSILTSGVPALSVNYENRRQVFVESKYDQIFYELISRKLSSLNPNEVSLDFLCSGGDGSAGCSQVKEVVNKLSGFGNTQIFGIIDWDGKNKEDGRVKVFGMGNRYSIENYILDPLILLTFLIREKYENKSDYGLDDNQSFFDIGTFDNGKLQTIVDIFIKKVEHLKEINADISLVVCTLLNGNVIHLPKWYLMYQGHDLEGSLKEIFRPLQKYRREGDLKRDIIIKVFDDVPNLIPSDFIDLFESIRNH